MLLNKYKKHQPICKEYGQMTDSCQPSHKIIRPYLLTWGLVNKTKIEKISLKHGSLIFIALLDTIILSFSTQRTVSMLGPEGIERTK